MTAPRTIALAFTGASGLPYGLRLLECLLASEVRVFLVYSAAAQVVARHETDLILPAQPHAAAALLAERYRARPGQLTVFGREDDTIGRGPAGARDFEGERGGGLDPRRCEVVGGRKAPGAIQQDADADAMRFAAGDVADFSVLGGYLAFAGFDGSNVGVGNARTRGGFERRKSKILHRGVIRPPSLSCSVEAVRGKRVE